MGIESMQSILTLNQFFGLWPYDDGPLWKKILNRCILYFNAASFGYWSISTSVNLMMDFENMDNIATLIDFSTVFISSTFRSVYVTVRHKTYLKMMDHVNSKFVNESFNNLSTKKSVDFITTRGKRALLFYTFFCTFLMSQMGMMPVILYYWKGDIKPAGLPYIFQGWHPFAHDVEPQHSLVFISQATTWVFVASCYLSIDSFWYMLICLVISQFQIIAHSLDNISKSSAKTFHAEKVTVEFEELSTFWPKELKEISQERITAAEYKVLLRCVEQLQETRKTITMMENLINPILLVDIVHGLLSITFLLLDIIIWLSRGDPFRVMTSVEYLAASTIHMFLYDYLSNEMLLQEQKVAEAIYNIPWYRDPLLAKDPLVLTLAACRKPVLLTRGKFAAMSNEFFVQTMMTIFSYFMVIYQLRTEDMAEKSVVKDQ